MENKQFFTSREVATMTNKSIVVVSRWAKKNDVQREGIMNGILLYKWTADDVKRFIKGGRK